MSALTRADYAKLPTQELRRRLAAARDRATRAETSEAYLADEFAAQEIEAALSEREE